MRKTIQLKLVGEALESIGSHATADEVYDEVTKTYPDIGKGTVYRNLQKLCDVGEARKVEVPDGADVYDLVITRHYHVRCTRCGKIFDVDMPYITGLEQEIKDQRGFRIIDHDIMFKGICPDCIKNETDERR